MTTGPLLYLLDLDTGGCRFDVRWNDVPILRRASPRKVAAAFPLNPWTVGGANVLTVEVLPPEDGAAFHRSARCEALVLARPLRDHAAPRTPLGGVVFRGADVAAGGTGFESSPPAGGRAPVVDPRRGEARRAAASIVLDVPFPRWRWLDARRVEASPVVRAELERAYRRAWDALAARDEGAVRRLLAAKAVEYAAAYHAGGEAEGHELLRVLELLGDADYELLPLSFEGMRLDVVGGGRLARIVDDGDDGPLRFMHREGHTGAVVEVVWCLETTGWLAVR